MSLNSPRAMPVDHVALRPDDLLQIGEFLFALAKFADHGRLADACERKTVSSSAPISLVRSLSTGW